MGFIMGYIIKQKSIFMMFSFCIDGIGTLNPYIDPDSLVTPISFLFDFVQKGLHLFSHLLACHCAAITKYS